MKKLYAIPLILFLLGMVFTIIGALFKIKHWPYASWILIFGMLTEAIAIISVIAIVFKKKL